MWINFFKDIDLLYISNSTLSVWFFCKSKFIYRLNFFIGKFNFHYHKNSKLKLHIIFFLFIRNSYFRFYFNFFLYMHSSFILYFDNFMMYKLLTNSHPFFRRRLLHRRPRTTARLGASATATRTTAWFGATSPATERLEVAASAPAVSSNDSSLSRKPSSPSEKSLPHCHSGLRRNRHRHHHYNSHRLLMKLGLPLLSYWRCLILQLGVDVGCCYGDSYDGWIRGLGHRNSYDGLTM